MTPSPSAGQDEREERQANETSGTSRATGTGDAAGAAALRLRCRGRSGLASPSAANVWSGAAEPRVAVVLRRARVTVVASRAIGRRLVGGTERSAPIATLFGVAVVRRRSTHALRGDELVGGAGRLGAIAMFFDVAFSCRLTADRPGGGQLVDGAGRIVTATILWLVASAIGRATLGAGRLEDVPGALDSSTITLLLSVACVDAGAAHHAGLRRRAGAIGHARLARRACLTIAGVTSTARSVTAHAVDAEVRRAGITRRAHFTDGELAQACPGVAVEAVGTVGFRRACRRAARVCAIAEIGSATRVAQASHGSQEIDRAGLRRAVAELGQVA